MIESTEKTLHYLYRSIEKLQNDVDQWLKYYNEERPHSGKYCYGKTPMETFLSSKHISFEKNNEQIYNDNISNKRELSYSQTC